MPHTLFLTGSLAPEALEKRLLEQKGPAFVLEFDTMLDRSRYPQVTDWLTVRDLLTTSDIQGFQKEMFAALSLFLVPRPGLPEEPGDADLRRTALNGAYMDSAFTQLLNTWLCRGLCERWKFDRLVVTAGCGVHFGFWRETAAAMGLPIEILPPRNFKRGLMRNIERWYYKRQSKKLESEGRSETGESVQQTANGPLVACVSKRVSHLLADGPSSTQFRVRHLKLADLGSPDAELLQSERARFEDWWQKWPTAAEASADASDKQLLQRFGPLLKSAGEDLIQRIFPRWSALRAKARALLQQVKPDALLADTQLAEEEGVWKLAALDLGIPVIAYSYDQVVNPKMMVLPAYVLADGMRTYPRALQGGYPEERLINVASHRRPRTPPRTEAQTEAVFTQSRPEVLFSDPMSVVSDPQRSMRCFSAIVEAARLLPKVNFVIKFHPLRAAKSELRSFVGMDESEVQSKMLFIRSLKAPANVKLLAPEASMELRLRSAAVLLNTTSMSGHEAFHMGIPVVFLTEHTTDSITFPELIDRMDMQVTENGKELAAILGRLITSKEFRQSHITAQKRYLDEFYWPSRIDLNTGVCMALDKLGLSQ
ncbi:glycosyltransferase [Brevifollis gellanilyticus]|uniref:Capsule polysaccharide biosynthesis protein n=1 Tax=Brevifollis gellanilyticus TaxID=748831 RepID=A0A512M6Z7_9BACT|nr:glycosyltransferase [Brevifollis gellanilyticus]GEP42494.1 hypothetical protein BGE01nite_17850 [Brevifollis gellanilyticus]